MDFLDPAKKRAHLIRLLIGYCLMAILVTILTAIVVFGAYGFDINRRTGEVIQNSLVFVDSEPSSASVYVNGHINRATTNTRLSLPAGSYSIAVTKTGYRDWRRSLTVEGGAVERLTYPKLFPVTLEPIETQVFKLPTLATQSPDRSRTLLQFPEQLGAFFDFDLNAQSSNSPVPTNAVILPATILSSPKTTKSLSPIEWSTDNRYVLLRHEFSGGFEFVVLDHENPASSVNINKTLNISPGEVRLRDKKFEQLYILSGPERSLQLVDVKTKALTPIATNVGLFKNAGATNLIYSQQLPGSDKTGVYVRENNQSHLLREFAADQKLFIDLARHGSSWFHGVGSANEGKVYVYADPYKTLSKISGARPVPLAVLKVDKPANMEFSPSGRFLILQGGQNFASFDAEAKRGHKFEAKNPFGPDKFAKWMDDYRLIYNSNGTTNVFDFDGSNQYELVPTDANLPPLFDRDYKRLYTVAPSKSKPTQAALFRTPLALP